MTPKINEVWRTKGGNDVLIIFDCEKPQQLGMLWYDEIDGTMCFSKIADRLDRRLEMTAKQWLLTKHFYSTEEK